MKTIGITTLQDRDNYGAVLQTYALQETIRSFGADVYEVHMSNAEEEMPPQGKAAPIIRMLHMHGDRRHKLFEDFRNQNLCIRNLDENLIKKTDMFITGSDQVWNPAVTGGDFRFFLPFAPSEKRASYAASFGERPEENTIGTIRQALSEMQYLSVREESGVALIKELTGRPALRCVDPVLLLPQERWHDLAAEQDAGKRYCLLIMVQNDAELVEYAKGKAAEKGCELVAITASWYPPLGFDAWASCGVPSWLALVRDAELVITSSYHGLLFSMIFDRCYEVAGLGGALQARNTRVHEMLRILGQESQGKGWKNEGLLQEERSRSLEYLESLIK